MSKRLRHFAPPERRLLGGCRCYKHPVPSGPKPVEQPNDVCGLLSELADLFERNLYQVFGNLFAARMSLLF